MIMINIYKRKDKMLKQKRNDAYSLKAKISEPSYCEHCKSVFINGRWTWKAVQGGEQKTICPACRRIADHYPAGIIELKGSFFFDNQNEILNLIHNVSNQEKKERALERIMQTRQEADRTIVTTTGVHIARRIGEALSRSYKGKYTFQYADGDKQIRVYWQR